MTIATVLSLAYFAFASVGQSRGLDANAVARATAGDPHAQVELGRAYQKGVEVAKDDDAARSWYRKAADQGDSVGQYELGLMLVYGWGGVQSAREGVELLVRSADHGNPSAQTILGQLYEDGGLSKYARVGESTFVDLTPKNDLLAAKYYRLAAEHGVAVAQNHLGMMYMQGRGVQRNYQEAYFWLTIGNAGGSHSATDNVDDRDEAATHISPTALAKLQQRATEWFAVHPPLNPFR